jgi:hypothetical protein
MFFLWFLNDQMDGGKSGATARSPIGTYPGRMVGCCVILWALLAVNSQLSGVDIFHVNQCRSSFYYSTDSTDSTPYLENKIRSVQSNLCFISVAFRGHCLHPPDISRSPGRSLRAQPRRDFRPELFQDIVLPGSI